MSDYWYSGVEAESFQYDNSWFPDIFRPMIHDSFIEFLHDSWFIYFLSMIYNSQPARWCDSWFPHFFFTFFSVIHDSRFLFHSRWYQRETVAAPRSYRTLSFSTISTCYILFKKNGNQLHRPFLLRSPVFIFSPLLLKSTFFNSFKSLHFTTNSALHVIINIHFRFTHGRDTPHISE